LTSRSFVDGNGREVQLTRSETAFLSAFVGSPCRVLSCDQLRHAVVGRGAELYDRNIDMLVARLRRKIELDPKTPAFILTVPGLGYKFATRPQSVGNGNSPPGGDMECPTEARVSAVDQAAAPEKITPRVPDQVGSTLSESARRQVTDYFPIPDVLTPREREIATLASAGLSNKQIARQSNLVEGTVKIHLHNIYRKLGVKNRTALAALLNGYRLNWTNSSMARPTLSSKSLGVATLASAGLSNKQIARRSNLVEGTVKIHLHNIYRKLGVKNRTALAALLNGYRLDWTNSSSVGIS